MNNKFGGFIPIHTIFYSVFHPTEGTKVSYEFPPDNLSKHKINFDAIKNYVIPKPQLCGKLLTLKYNNYRIVGYPITINSSLYARNNFSFNLVFVFPYDCETSPYESVVERLGKMFCELEEQCQFLSKSEKTLAYFDFKLISNVVEQVRGNSNTDISISDSNLNQNSNLLGMPNSGSGSNTAFNMNSHETSNTQDKANSKELEYLFNKYNNIQDYIKNDQKQLSMNDILMRVFQELNSYSECYIPIDDGNAIDIKLFPTLMPPTGSIAIEDVPIPTVNLNKIIDVNWDPTMLKIVPFVDGLNSIYKIAKLSDSDSFLVIECIRHFVYYGCVILSDIFQFSNIYAPTSTIRDFLTNPTMATECQIYCTSPEGSTLSILPFEKRKKFSRSEFGTSVDSHFTSSKSDRRNTDSQTGSFSSTGDSIRANMRYQNTIYKSRPRSESSFSSGNHIEYNRNGYHLLRKATLFDLYRSLSQGVTLKDWYQKHFNIIRESGIDVRRFIIFGIIKKILYRCHSYPLPKSYDALKKLNGLEDIKNSSANPKSKSQGYTYNIFSTSDIKFGSDLSDAKKKRFQTLDVDVADKVLNSVYKKLSVNTTKLDLLSKTESSPHLSKVAFESPTKEHFPNLVRNLTIDENAYSREISINDTLAIVDAIQTAENLDNICSQLELSREEVERLLSELTEYRIINC